MFVVDIAFLSALAVFLVEAGVFGELRGFLFVLGVVVGFDGVDDEAVWAGFLRDLPPAASDAVIVSGGLIDDDGLLLVLVD